MDYVIVSGGELSCSLLDLLLKGEYKGASVIACDRGLEAFGRLGAAPEVIIGDFDSVSEETLCAWRKKAEMIGLPREKDVTDTHYACLYAMEHGAKKILIMGGTGGRLDHTLGNLALLALCKSRGTEAILLDEKNRVRMVTESLEIKKAEQYGTYVSVIPYGGTATVSLEGFYYPLFKKEMSPEESLGISNEITADSGFIMVESGMLLVVESKDS